MNRKLQLFIVVIVAQQASALTSEEIDRLPVKGPDGQRVMDGLRRWFEAEKDNEHSKPVLDSVAAMLAKVDEDNWCTNENYELIKPNFDICVKLPSDLMIKTCQLAHEYDMGCIKKVEDAISNRVDSNDADRVIAFKVAVENKKNTIADSKTYKISKSIAKKRANGSLKKSFEKVRPACQSYVDALKDILVPDFKYRLEFSEYLRTIEDIKETMELCKLFLSGGQIDF